MNRLILVEQYLLVARCWNNHTESIRQNMTSEKAIQLLGECVQSSNERLRYRAGKLLDAIIFDQEEPDYLKHLSHRGLHPVKS